MTMTKTRWEEAKGILKQKYAQLTDDDFQFTEGKTQEMYGRIQKKTGKSKEEIYKFLSDL